MELEFETVTDLYKRITPALRTKRRELKKDGLSMIKEEDIWNYLKESKWKKSQNLSLANMVNDILTVKYLDMDNYIRKQLEEILRNTQVYNTEII